MKILKILASIILGLFVLGMYLIFYFVPAQPEPINCEVACENCLTEKQLKGQFQRPTSRSFLEHKYYKCVDCQVNEDCKPRFSCLDNRCTKNDN